MTNILITSEEFLLSTTREVYKKFLFLEEQKLCHVKLVNQNKLSASDFNWCDVIIAVRSFSDFDLRLSRLAKSKGKFFILYIDDDLLGLASDYGRYKIGVWPKRKEALKNLLPSVDVLASCNPLLARKYSAIGNGLRYCVINAAVKEDELFYNKTVLNNLSKEIKIVYYVNDGSLRHFEAVMRPVMPMLADAFPHKISLTLMTVRPDLSEYESLMKVRYIGHMGYSEFKKFMIQEHFDIGIAPLIPGGFSQYKYFNKYIEFSRYGIAGIYSSCEPYTFVIKNDINGILCSNDPLLWFNAIKKLISEPKLRENIVHNAQRQLLEEFSIENIMDETIKHIPELVTYKSDLKCPRLTIFILHLYRYKFVIEECLYFSRLALLNGGIKLFCLRVYRYLKRIIIQKREEKNYRRSHQRS